MKSRLVAGVLALSVLAVPLSGCAHRMSDEDVDTVREMACSLQNSYATSASFAIDELNPGKFWALGPKIIDFSETLAVSGRMGDVATAYADFAGMFPEQLDPSLGVTEADVETFNGHIEAIATACEGNADYEAPLQLEYPTDPEDQGYLQRLEP
ncbi:hypothetical protein MUN76_10040 [Leucobacter rhizosphaerae]|uniref:Lipoprotein n=1 Tax=Leucobacter rhizosphaerae TaxID=2932245 RepID=A0ABY4FT96_9MICO|nr:hypothetical protein [Leucobacter rhizosphaerae]UOQ59394.1 hypothetical protein MUN76_10040 [Leucobacter rhizosphaerae]